MPLGSPSYSATRSTSPDGFALKIRPYGMSVKYRLPAASKHGPSRKLCVLKPRRCTISHSAVVSFLRHFSGSAAKTSVCNSIGWSSIYSASFATSHSARYPQCEIRVHDEQRDQHIQQCTEGQRPLDDAEQAAARDAAHHEQVQPRRRRDLPQFDENHDQHAK